MKEDKKHLTTSNQPQGPGHVLGLSRPAFDSSSLPSGFFETRGALTGQQGGPNVACSSSLQAEQWETSV